MGIESYKDLDAWKLSIRVTRFVYRASEKFPADELKPGDVLITNDPWLGTGHLNDFVQVAPRACLTGGASVELGGFVGAGAVVLQGVRIGAWSVVGAGAVVTRDVEPGTTVIGVPAREKPSANRQT